MQVRAKSAAFGPLGASTTLLSYSVPVSNDRVTIDFSQSIGANEALRTGTYAKTLTFTLSTTNPWPGEPAGAWASRRLGPSALSGR